MKVRFIGSGEPGEDEVCTVFEQDFPRGEWVETSNQKLVGNPAFETDADEDGAADLDPAALKAQLDELGVKYHHKAGPEKLLALLDEATKPPAE
jgi:hypothetical protein